MPDARILIVRLGSLGDVVHTLPAAVALRETFPQAQLDWVVERRWHALLDGHPGLSTVIPLDRGSWTDVVRCVRRLRAARYTCALDFQSLYKSAVLALASGAPRRVGFDRRYAREGGATLFYTERVAPKGAHKVEHNLSLAESMGAQSTAVRYQLSVPALAEEYIERELAARDMNSFFVLCPGGGWRSKCWPPERFGELHREFARRTGWRGVVSVGPREWALAEAVRSAAGDPEPLLVPLDVSQLMALVERAKFVVAGDTGPLHLAVALGTPVIGLYGPTDPARNGPFCDADIVVRNAGPEETTYRRGREFSRSMLSITVEQVLEAVERRLGMG